MEPNQVDANLLYSLFMVFTGFVLQSLLPMAYCSVATSSMPINPTLGNSRAAKGIINIFYFSHLLLLVKVEVVLVKVEDDFLMKSPLKLIICIESHQKIGGNPENIIP